MLIYLKFKQLSRAFIQKTKIKEEVSIIQHLSINSDILNKTTNRFPINFVWYVKIVIRMKQSEVYKILGSIYRRKKKTTTKKKKLLKPLPNEFIRL